MSNQPEVLFAKRYLLHKELGRGGMGTVYQATDRLTGQKVALKRVFVPTAQLSFATRDRANDLNLALAQEFRVMATLRHPNINSVLDYGFDEEHTPYFTMELLENAKMLFRASWSKPDDEKANLLIQILQALAYLHRRGVIHRDLKPGNILVVNGQIKVLDFGVSVLREQIDPMSNPIAGTIDFIAPEIFDGEPPSESSDLYAVGVIAYEMFAGKSAYSETATAELVQAILTKTPDFDAILNRPVALVIAQLLSKTPAGRYPNADEAIQALCAAIGQPPPPETIAIRESFLQAARFVGRDKELTQLGNRLLAARSGEGSTWLIAGESGVGKTRLLEELRIQALVQGVMVLRGQNISEGYSPYQMWRAPLRWLALETDLSDEDASVLKALVPDLDTLLGREIPDSRVNPLQAQERLLVLIEKIFTCQEQAILLMLEDLHWAGSESIAALDRLTALAPNLRLLIVATYRDDESRDLPAQVPGSQVLKLQRLEEDSIVELTTAMLGEQGRQPHLLELLQRETEGNVFFLVEIVRALAEQAGQLHDVTTMDLPEHVFARGIHQIVQHRLDRVPEESRPLLKVAAVAGRQLDLKLLRQFGGNEVEQWLAVCSNTAVLDVQDGIWRFAHDQLRDGLLEDLVPDERRTLHEQVATAIETVYLYSPEYITAEAYHWSMAGDTDKEAQYSALAGEQALNSGAYGAAVNFLERALDLIKSDISTGKKRASLKREIGESYLGLGEYERARELFQESLEIVRQADYTWGIAVALNDLGSISQMMEDYDGATGYFREALKTAMAIRALPVAFSSIIGLASIMAHMGDKEGAAELAALTLANLATDRQTADRAQSIMDELSSELDPEIITAVKDRASLGSINVAVKRLLAE